MKDRPMSQFGLNTAKGLGPSGMLLVAANLIPLAGVLVWDWSVFHVVVVYWLENVIIGVVNIFKMITCSPDPKQIDLKGKLMQRLSEKQEQIDDEEAREAFEFTQKLESNKVKLAAIHHASKLFFIPFFTFHYGFFCLVHGVFIFALLGKDELIGGCIIQIYIKSGTPSLAVTEQLLSLSLMLTAKSIYYLMFAAKVAPPLSISSKQIFPMQAQPLRTSQRRRVMAIMYPPKNIVSTLEVE